MIRLGLLVVVFAACAADNKTSSSGADITGDQCAVHDDQASCTADSGCAWAELGRPCMQGEPCVSGSCYSSSGAGSGSSGGGSTGSGTGMAACACPDGGTCFEQLGGPAQQSGSDPEIQCTTPAAGDGDPCARIQGQGTCTDDPNVGGLCLCDNGER